jgi:hypothetical protein
VAENKQYKYIYGIGKTALDIPESDDHSLSGAPDDVWLDLSKTLSLAKKLDFISLHEGLRRTLEWQKLNLF